MSEESYKKGKEDRLKIIKDWLNIPPRPVYTSGLDYYMQNMRHTEPITEDIECEIVEPIQLPSSKIE